MGRSANYTKQNCAVAATLDIVGDPWTLLVIRDALRGVSRFEQWQESLGMARNVLAARLKHLVRHGIFETRLYCERPKRHDYVLTDRGRDLRPLILHMMEWGMRHVYGDVAPGTVLIHSCGHDLTPVVHCGHCQAPMQPGDVSVRLSPDAPTVGQLLDQLKAAG